MRTMLKAGILILLCLFVGIAACGSDDGDGGCTHDIYIAEVTGPTTLAPSAVGTYQIFSADGVGRYRWRVEGNGVLKTMADQPSVIVRASATGGGTFTVYCDVKVEGTWYEAKPLEVTVGSLARFRVVLNTPANLTPTTLTGSGTLTMTSNAAGAARWSLYFDGDTSGLTAQVPVTVQTTDGQFTLQNVWLNLAKQTKILSFPRTGGGSVGLGGSVWDLGAPRPALLVGGPGESATVTLSATGVETMVITVKYQ